MQHTQRLKEIRERSIEPTTTPGNFTLDRQQGSIIMKRNASRSGISGRSRMSSATSRHPSICEDFDRMHQFRNHYKHNKASVKKFHASEKTNEITKRNFALFSKL